MTGQVGTPGWTAPEVFRHLTYDHKVDVYSFGIVAECLSREKPYAGMDAMQAIFATVYRNKRPAPEGTLLPLEKLIKACWDAEPKKRPPMNKVLDTLRALERAAARAAQPAGVRRAQAGGGTSSPAGTAAPSRQGAKPVRAGSAQPRPSPGAPSWRRPPQGMRPAAGASPERRRSSAAGASPERRKSSLAASSSNASPERRQRRG